ncbi:MAG: 3-hydroxybutyryl-CoA dehydrogenase [Elusimicrobia bacterium]|nr:3-hydroxybutyryl-CoA dehydrogenase [Elusimicrobiota bacterium]
MEIKEIGVVGGGTMGSGIAHAFALSGLGVTLMEATQELADKALASIAKNMDRQAAKGAIKAADKAAALSRIKTALAPEALGAVQLVVEAVPENADLKKSLFAKLDGACPPDAVLASNTSSIPIKTLAAATKRPDKVIGMHFMNPVPIMKLVEIIRSPSTSEETYNAVRDLTLKLGKVPACSQDFPGFIANRILMPMLNEAVFALSEGLATKEDIDTVMKLGMNHPMGPLTLADFIGLDVCLAIMEVLHEGFGTEKYRPAPLLKQMVAEGKLGRKSGRGFYDYGGA